ncbi:MAG: bifunctional (p)ppGpp synthetase/guanosine-3',5'-bis(diphosphate) 3'-pyrophosphohydrolase [Pseudomonadota bacterium]
MTKPQTLSSKRPPGFIRQYELVDLVKAYDPYADEDLLNKAYVFAMQAHGDQKRSSGDPYFSHPLAVAGILTDLKLDPATIATALLHDVVEDTNISIEEIKAAFGPEVAQLVDGVTKISKRELAPDTDGKAENFAKFLLATAKDVRVLLVKLADRLHNMRTLHFLKKAEKQERIAKETMEIYAPLAGRIGVQKIKEELEDLSFQYLNPGAYEAISESLQRLSEQAIHDVIALAQTVRTQLQTIGLEAEVYSREKRAFSIWRKMQRKGTTFEELADIYAFRVIVANTAACYQALGVIHQAFKMIPGEFDDYISTPKPNGYQSIHTAVLATSGPQGGGRVEIQIRSKEMHDTAERGVAAHWRYKDKSAQTESDASIEIGREGQYGPYNWLRGVIGLLNSGEGAATFLAQAKMDLYQDQVFPFTPKGRVIPLPRGATTIDFAYALHTEIGNQYAGARINGVQRPNRTPLRNGDVVEIMKSENAAIPMGWEGLVTTGAAKAGIRRRLRDLKTKEQRALGERIASSAFAARDIDYNKKAIRGAAKKLGYANARSLLEAVGAMDVSGQEVIKAAFPNMDARHLISTSQAIKSGDVLPSDAISLHGVTPGAAVRLAPCCHPLPGERIVGVRDSEGGILAHRINCDQLEHVQDQEWLNLAWSEEAQTRFIASISLTVNNRTKGLQHIGSILTKYNTDLVDISIRHREIDFAEICIDLTVKGARHLTNILTALKASDYVVAADRREEEDA